ncbi:MOSC domain-containing protein [Nocardioides sp.]|uniref:MOSC domain-containing protein n=1 Tax=Nocardioides sp. TaxID=35761 RepID=UPI002CB9C21B|nr:MOSC domain-containing protein [Nocardioides sp.]HXH80797.1 MOSC domain-containing protein [Nocardioides sp.]
MLLTGLAIHPVKSTAIRPVGSARVLLGGLEGDRAWVVVDADGVMVTAREEHPLFTIVADTPATDPSVASALRLRAPEMPDLLLDQPVGDRVRARVFSQELEGIPVGLEADAWVQKSLRRDDLRLLWCDDPTRRTLDPAHSRPEDFTAYADGYPVTIASEASLRQLNDWIIEGALERGEDPSAPLPMERFRPNLVVDGDTAFGEDDWTSVQVGDVRFRVAKPNARCVITTIDLDSLQTNKEPIRTLARHRLVDSLTMFATNLIPETTGIVRVGDHVDVS